MIILAHSKEWANAMARRPSSVRLSVCKLLRKSLLLADKWPDRHQTCTRWTPGQRASRVCSRWRSRSKVTWYAHLCWHKNRFFSQANGWIATKLAHDGHQVSLHPECSQGQGQGQRSRDTRTFLVSWNELLRHWRSGLFVLSNLTWVMVLYRAAVSSLLRGSVSVNRVALC